MPVALVTGGRFGQLGAHEYEQQALRFSLLAAACSSCWKSFIIMRVVTRPLHGKPHAATTPAARGRRRLI
jgi:hypothetical protein